MSCNGNYIVNIRGVSMKELVKSLEDVGSKLGKSKQAEYILKYLRDSEGKKKTVEISSELEVLNIEKCF